MSVVNRDKKRGGRGLAAMLAEEDAAAESAARTSNAQLPAPPSGVVRGGRRGQTQINRRQPVVERRQPVVAQQGNKPKTPREGAGGRPTAAPRESASSEPPPPTFGKPAGKKAPPPRDEACVDNNNTHWTWLQLAVYCNSLLHSSPMPTRRSVLLV